MFILEARTGRRSASPSYSKSMKKLFLPLFFVAVTFAKAPKVTVFAPVPPPPGRVEAHGLPPSTDSVWIDGYWAYEGDHHVWHAGKWEKPPRPNARYITPHWDRKGDKYAFHEGYWKYKGK